MEKIDICPFCASEQIIENNGTYYCAECEREFTKDDVEFEFIRHQVSAILFNEDATEKNPIECDNYNTFLAIGDDEAQGLSELQKPHIEQIFQDCEGIIWVKIEGTADYTEFDDLSLSDARNILLWLKDNLQSFLVSSWS